MTTAFDGRVACTCWTRTPDASADGNTAGLASPMLLASLSAPRATLRDAKTERGRQRTAMALGGEATPPGMLRGAEVKNAS
jgi:hypothetical protein